MATILIGIFVFFNPFPHTTAIKEISFYSSLFYCLTLVLFIKRDFALKSPFMLPFLLFLFWVIIGIFLTLDPSNTIHDIYAHYIKYLYLSTFCLNFYQSEKRFIFLAWIIIISASLLSIGGFDLFLWYPKPPYSPIVSVSLKCLLTISACPQFNSIVFFASLSIPGTVGTKGHSRPGSREHACRDSSYANTGSTHRRDHFSCLSLLSTGKKSS